MDKIDARRGKVTDEHREEARLLKALWMAKRPRDEATGKPMSQEQFGLAFEIGNQAAVGFFLNGQTALSPKAAAGFARGLQCSIAEFSPRLARQLYIGEPEPRAAEWPFERVSRARWEACSERDRGYIEAAINKALDECEAVRVSLASTAAPASSSRKPPPLLAA